MDIEVIKSDIEGRDIYGVFDLITFNKVLEHVKDPVNVLRKIIKNCNEKTIVYIELPDGEMASKKGKSREEFFIDHLHVFNMESMIKLAKISGFKVIVCERIKEPSSKYTLFAFLKLDI